MLVEEGIVRRQGNSFSKLVFFESIYFFFEIILFLSLPNPIQQLRLDRMLESEGVIGNEAGEFFFKFWNFIFQKYFLISFN